MPTEPESKSLPGLEGATGTLLERVPVRTREGRVTVAAWRLNVTSPRGEGAIVMVDTNLGAVFRGEGLFFGWEQDKLDAAYRALLPKPGEHDSPMAGPQLG
jgi:hypothetical protein